MSVKEDLVQINTSTLAMVPKVRILHGHKTQADHCVFVKRYDGRDFLILLLYVDCGTGPKENRKLEKGIEQIVSNEGYVSD